MPSEGDADDSMKKQNEEEHFFFSHQTASNSYFPALRGKMRCFSKRSFVHKFPCFRGRSAVPPALRPHPHSCSSFSPRLTATERLSFVHLRVDCCQRAGFSFKASKPAMQRWQQPLMTHGSIFRSTFFFSSFATVNVSSLQKVQQTLMCATVCVCVHVPVREGSTDVCWIMVALMMRLELGWWKFWELFWEVADGIQMQIIKVNWMDEQRSDVFPWGFNARGQRSMAGKGKEHRLTTNWN